MVSVIRRRVIRLVIALWALSTTVLSAVVTEARTFANSYVSFDLPERWGCYPEHTEWVCRISGANGQTDALIVLTAKEAGTSDTLGMYHTFLKQPRVIQVNGKSLPSKVYRVEETRIANHPWVDGFHFSSEVYSYYTRYLGTTKEKLGILVTFSAHKSHYTKYSGDFLHAIATLRVVATIAQMNAKFSDEFSGPHGVFVNQLEGLPPMEPMAEDDFWSRLFSEGSMKTTMGGLLILGAIGFYLIIRKKK